MSDFSDLKKRVDTFVKEIKAFSLSLSGSDDAEKQQQRYIELRDKKKEFALEVKDFEPAKKILMLESRKSTLLKSIQDELTKVEKAMTKQKIEVPKDDDADEDSTDKKGKKKKDEDQQDEGKSKGKKDKKDSGKNKSGKDDKKGKNKVEVVDDDSKSVTSAKSKKSELENDFVDTDEGEEGDAQADEAGELEENEEDQVEEAATSKEKGAAQLKEEDKSDKKDKKSKDKKKDKSAAKKDKDSGKKGDKKSRKDSEKSAAPDEENEDEADEVDEGKSKKSKKSEKSKKDKESKKSKKDKASKKSKKTKEADEEEDEEEAGEDEKEEKKKDKKDKRKSKEVEESKEDKKDKRKSKEVEESKEDKKDKRKSKEVEESKEDKKDKRKSKEVEESKEDKKDKQKSKEVKETKEDKKDKRKSKEVEESKEDNKSKAKEGKTDSKETIEESKMEKVTAGQVQTAATGEARQQSFADDEEEFEEEEEEDDEDNEFPSEREDGGATYEMIMTRQTTQVQSSRPQLAAQAPAALAQAPAALAPPPTPAPRRNEDSPTAESSRATKVATHRLGEAPQRFEEEEEDDDEDEESGYDYENMRTLGPNESNSYEVVQSYSEDDPDIMPIQKGELLKVLKIGPDGWWLARNSRNQEGLVPNTLLKPSPKDEEQEFDDEEEYEADSQSVGTGYMVPNEMSQTDQTEPTEEYESDEDEDYEDEIMADSGGVHEQQLPPGMPSGFRVSNLAKWFYEGTKRYPGRQFALQSLLHPKLSASCMSLQNGWGYTPQARPVATRIEKLVHLQKCLVMPHGLPAQVLDRFVRLCLFDGQGPVSNVHTVRATVTAKDDRTWSFGTRATDTSSGLDYGELYLRYNFGQNNVQLLLEATVVCKSETSEPIELSIGHVTVPLFDEKNGGPMPAKAFDLPFEGGTPFDNQQEVDSKLGQFGTQTKAKPHIQLKLTVPNKETKEFMDLCPTTILGNLANLQLHSLYRHVLASELGLSNQAIEHGANAIYAPHLVQFPIIADQPDLMDVLRRRWNEFAKRERAFRKPAASEVMKQEFIRIVKSTYFISQMKDFQPYAFGNKTQEQFRANAIQDFLRKIATDQSAVSFSLSSDLIFEPFSMQEVALPMIGQFSVPVLPVASE